MSPAPAESEEFIVRLSCLYSAVVGDVLDQLGFRRQSLPAHVRALTPVPRVCGRIFTARAESVAEVPSEPYALEIQAVDRMQAGDVLVVEAGDNRECGFWGELLTTACMAKGVRGVVMTACTRDLWKLKSLEFPVFGIGAHPADSLGRADIVELGGEIALGEVPIACGDFVLGDEDGVVVIPAGELAKVLELAERKVAGENTVRDELARGEPMGEVFARHGIL